MVNPNINSFTLTPLKGDLRLRGSAGLVTTAQVDPSLSSTTPIVPGQAVQLMDTAGGIPQVTPLTANTNVSWGVALYNVKDQNFPAKAPLEIAQRNSVVFMEAGAAIGRGRQVEFVYTTNKVIAWAGINPPIGIAYDKATADGDLIGVLIGIPVYHTTSA